MESETVRELGIEVFSDEQNVSSLRCRQDRLPGAEAAGQGPRPKAWRVAPYLSTSTHSIPGSSQGKPKSSLADNTTWKVLQYFPCNKDHATTHEELLTQAAFHPDSLNLRVCSEKHPRVEASSWLSLEIPKWIPKITGFWGCQHVIPYPTALHIPRQ